MTAPNDGGPAFPILEASQNQSTGDTIVFQAYTLGLSVRDYFAAKAMQTLLADPTCELDDLGDNAYAIAETMLKARQA